MRLISRIVPLAALFYPLYAQLISAPALPSNQANVSMIPIAPIADCSAEFLCSDAVEKGKIAWHCKAEVSCNKRTGKSGQHFEGNLSSAGVTWTAGCSLYPVTVDSHSGHAPNKADSGCSAAPSGCPGMAPQNSTTVARRPTTHSWHPNSGIVSKSSIRPRPIRTTLPTQDPKVANTATATSGPWTTTLTLISTITVFLTLAA